MLSVGSATLHAHIASYISYLTSIVPHHCTLSHLVRGGDVRGQSSDDFSQRHEPLVDAYALLQPHTYCSGPLRPLGPCHTTTITSTSKPRVPEGGENRFTHGTYLIYSPARSTRCIFECTYELTSFCCESDIFESPLLGDCSVLLEPSPTICTHQVRERRLLREQSNNLGFVYVYRNREDRMGSTARVVHQRSCCGSVHRPTLQTSAQSSTSDIVA